MDTFDVVILGGGAGAKMIWGSVPGRSIAVVEESRVGGECPFVACVPSKAMLRSADVWHLAADDEFSPLFIGRVGGANAYREAVRRRDRIVHDRDDSLNAAALAKTGAQLLRGTGRIIRPGVLSVVGEEVGYRELVLNTGSTPVVPELPGLDKVPVWTSDQALSTSELPSSIVVLGGGPVGCELAFLYATFGIAVTLVQRNRRLIPREEVEASEAMARVLVDRGVSVHLQSNAIGVGPEAGGVSVQLEDGTMIEADRLVLAVGRTPRSSDLGLDVLGVTPGKDGAIEIDERCRVIGADQLWAVGDVTRSAPFTHTAHYQGRVVAANLRGHDVLADYRAVPRAVYTSPVLTAIGHTEVSARAAGIEPLVVTAPMTDTVRATTDGSRAGFVKLVADPRRGIIVGATGMGGRAEEWISEMALAVRAEVPVWVLADVVHPFPTFSEVLDRPIWELAGLLGI